MVGVDMEKAYKTIIAAIKAGLGVKNTATIRMIERGDLPITPQMGDAAKALSHAWGHELTKRDRASALLNQIEE